MKRSKYVIRTEKGENLGSFECDKLVITGGDIVGFNETSVKPRTQEVVFASMSQNIFIIKQD